MQEEPQRLNSNVWYGTVDVYKRQGWEDENHDPITSDPSIAETGTEITNPSWNITEETVTPQPVVK